MSTLKRELVAPIDAGDRALVDRAIHILDMTTEALEEYTRAGVRQAREDLRIVSLMLAVIERDDSEVQRTTATQCHHCNSCEGTYDEQDAQGRGLVTRCRRCGFALAVEPEP